MSTSSTKPGWLPVVGGPWDGREVYLSTDPNPEECVDFKDLDPDEHGGFYALSMDSKNLLWYGI